MKPKDLKFPFSWEERRPYLSDGVFYVPTYFDRHEESSFPAWREIFEKEQPVHLEYCSGNGAWIVQKAIAHPELNWVGVEKRFDRSQKIWSKTKNFGLKNLFIVCGEAWTFTHYYLKDQMVDGVYINFPDPWPKEKHAKHRLVQEKFVHELARVMKKSASIWLVTDDPTYCSQMQTEMAKGFAKLALQEGVEGYGSSYFDTLWRDKGREIFYLQGQR